jgi:hypothetical protein
MGIRRFDHATPLYPQKLVLTSLTSGGRSVGIVRSRAKATELVSYVNSLLGNDRQISNHTTTVTRKCKGASIISGTDDAICATGVVARCNC